jgi:hypothetical protein
MPLRRYPAIANAEASDVELPEVVVDAVGVWRARVTWHSICATSILPHRAWDAGVRPSRRPRIAGAVSASNSVVVN